jgi:hypothetical protein
METRERWLTLTLQRDITRILSELQARRIPLVLLGYPEIQHLEGMLDRFGDQEGVIRVHVSERFRQLLESAPRERYFVPDGHCSEEGYAVIAELVEEALIPLLDRAAAFARAQRAVEEETAPGAATPRSAAGRDG